MRLNEISRFADDFLRVTHNCSVVGMLLSEFVEDCSSHLMFVCERCRVCVGKIFFVERQRRLIDRGLRLLQVRLRALHDFFHRQVGGERETQLFPELP